MVNITSLYTNNEKGRRELEYLKKFVSSLKFLEEFNKEYRKQGNNFELIEHSLLKFCSTENENMYSFIRAKIEKTAHHFINRIPVENLINNCHIVSSDFYKYWKSVEPSNAFSIDVTIGNVYYQGKSMYDLSKSKLKTIINQGFQPDKELPVHVWLTLEDMTIFDLTIIPTLVAKGMLNLNEAKKTVLVWRENNPSDFYFEPFLIDNDFIDRVDKRKDVCIL